MLELEDVEDVGIICKTTKKSTKNAIEMGKEITCSY